MKLILEGNKKQVNQIRKELILRCKRDKIYMSVIEEIQEIEDPENLGENIKIINEVKRPRIKK